MNEFIEKLIKGISNKKDYFQRLYECEGKTEHDADLNKATQLAFDDCLSVIEQLAEEYNNDGWIPCSKQLPPHSDDLLLIQCSGKPKNNIVFDNAFCLASYTKEGWLLELYPEWKGAEVIAWMPLPEPFKPIAE